MNTNMFDTKLLAHAGIEMVVIGGVAFYYYKQISGLNERIKNLEAQNESLIKAVQEHDSYFREILTPGSRSGPKTKSRKSRPRPTPSPHKSKTFVDDEEIDEGFGDSDLDAELEKEYQELEECENGVCKLKR